MGLSNTISVVIPTHKRPAGLKNLLQSLVNQDLEPHKFQVIVVSNFHDKKSEQVVNDFSHQLFDLKYYVSEQKGCNIARNFGLRFSSCDIVYFVDDDCVLNSTSQLQQILNYHNSHPDASGIGGGYLDREENLSASEVIYSKNANLWLKKSANDKNETHHLIGGNASYKRNVFEQGYNYDSKITFGGSEVSLTKRLFNHGHKHLFFEELSILHDLKVNTFSILKKGFMQGRGKLINSSHHEADVFASHIKSIIPQKDNTVELQSGYQSLVWFLFHLMFKFGFHWSYFCRKNNIKNWLGALGAFGFLGKYFSLKVQTRQRKVNIEYKRQTNRLFWFSVRVKNFIRRGFRFVGIKVHCSWKKINSFFIKHYYSLSKKIQKFLQRLTRQLYWWPNKLKKHCRRLYHKTYKLILRRIYWLPGKVVRNCRALYFKLHKIIFRKIYWLPGKVMRMIRNFYYKLNKYVFRKIYWLPGKTVRNCRALYFKFHKIILRKIYWLPGKMMRIIRNFYFKLNKYVFRKIYWLPGKIMRTLRTGYYKARKFCLHSYYKINKKMIRPLFWLPGKIKRSAYKYFRKVKYFFIKTYWILYSLGWKIRGFVQSIPWKLREYCYKKGSLLWLIYSALTKPYYFLRYQFNKRLRKKTLSKS